MALTQTLIDAVNARLREEWGINIGSIDAQGLRRAVRETNSHDDVTIKIPSRSEFTMSIEEARAVLGRIG